MGYVQPLSGSFSVRRHALRERCRAPECRNALPEPRSLLKAHAAMAMPSVQTVVTYVKQLDDTIYAGVERTVMDRLAPTVESRRRSCAARSTYLAAHRSAASDEAFGVVAAASRLGGDQPTIPTDLSSKVDAEQSGFLASPAEAKPSAFTPGRTSSKRSGQQDRLLQRDFHAGETCALTTAIAADPGRRARYESLVSLYGKLTNPVKSSLVPLLASAATGTCTSSDSQAFLSASQTPENQLFEKLYPNGVPPEADLMADLIAAIRAAGRSRACASRRLVRPSCMRSRRAGHRQVRRAREGGIYRTVQEAHAGSLQHVARAAPRDARQADGGGAGWRHSGTADAPISRRAPRDCLRPARAIVRVLGASVGGVWAPLRSTGRGCRCEGKNDRDLASQDPAGAQSVLRALHRDSQDLGLSLLSLRPAIPPPTSGQRSRMRPASGLSRSRTTSWRRAMCG